MGQQMTDLPEEEERRAEYRRMAALARCRAINSKIPELKDVYNSMASVWDAMADELQPPPRTRPQDWLAMTQKLQAHPTDH
jgi:hypothetical protein